MLIPVVVENSYEYGQARMHCTVCVCVCACVCVCVRVRERDWEWVVGLVGVNTCAFNRSVPCPAGAQSGLC